MFRFKKLLCLLLCFSFFASSLVVYANDSIAYVANQQEESTFEDQISDEDQISEERGLGNVLVKAGGLAVADGPIPIGDLLATGYLTYKAGELIVSQSANFFDWLVDNILDIFLSEGDVEDGDEVEVKFPEFKDELDELLGIKGQNIPDGASTPGRKKTVWNLGNGDSIRREKHPYDTEADASHRGWHYHVELGSNKTRHLKGDTIPNGVWEKLK